MSKITNIAWCDHTFNPAWGCSKVSPGCANCYADTFSTRYGHDVWGFEKDGSRKSLRTFGDKHWDEPLKWDREARVAGVRRRVFCASMADVFEDHPQWPELRARLFRLILATPHLDWLLLTKRPENLERFLPPLWGDTGYPNAWLGTSVENQEYANRRIPELLKVPAAVHFLSLEPLLGPVHLGNIPIESGENGLEVINALTGAVRLLKTGQRIFTTNHVGWVIVGGESGPGAREMGQHWAEYVQNQCAQAGTPYFFKQTGSVLARAYGFVHPKGEDPAEWPQRWQVQQFPEVRR